MLVIFTKYYILLLTCGLAALISGKMVLSFFKYNEKRLFFNLFLELTVGISIWVILYSLIRTELKTVNVLFIYVLISCGVIYRKQIFSYFHFNFKRFKGTHKDILILIIILIPFYIYESFFLIKRGQFHFHIPDNDYFSYSSWSELLNINGFENKFSNLTILFPGFYKGMMPYHYFELWLNALISKLTSQPNIITLLVVTYPLTYAIFTLGLISVFEKYRRLNFINIIFVFILIIIGGVFIDYYNNFEFLKWGSLNYTSILSIYGKKFGIVYVFMLLSALTYLENKPSLSIILLSIIPILSMGTAFGIIGGMLLFLMLNVLHKVLTTKEILIILLHYTGLSIVYFSLYKFFGTSYTDKYAIYLPDLSQIVRNPFHILLYKRILSNFLIPLVRFIIYYLPYLLLFIVSYNSIKKTIEFSYYLKYLILVSSILIIGNLASALAFPLLDFAQLFQNVIPVFNIAIILFIIQFIINNNKLKSYKRNLLLIFITVISVYNLYSYYKVHLSAGIKRGKYSDNYIVQVLDVLSKSKVRSIGFYLLPNEEFSNTEFLSIFRVEPAIFIKFQQGYWQLVNLNIPKEKYKNEVEKYYAESFSEFYIFIKRQKESHKFISNEISQKEFIETFKIKYFFSKLDSDKVPPLIREKIIKEIIDPRSKEHFYLLK